MFREESSESLKQIIYGGTIAFLVLAGFVIFFLLMYMRRKTKNVLEKEQLRSSFQKELLQTQLEIQEQTLKTISQEIHDNIGQVLSLAKLNLNTMDLSRQEELKEKITDSKNLVGKAIQDLRDLSKSFNTDNIAAMGLLRAIEYQLEMIRKTGFETILEVSGDVVKMEPQKELIVFRILQETLNNIIKHAEAEKIIVTVTYSVDQLILIVQDNGRGVDLSLLDQEKAGGFGLGIRNMHNRANMIGALFKMNSALQEGTTVKLIVPFTKHTT